MINPQAKLSPKTIKRGIEMLSARDGFGQGLILAGEKNNQVVVLDADLAGSTRVNYFKDKFPDRFIEVGVAEQALVTVASGMAAYGKIPFISSYAVFNPGRNWEQIRTTIAINNYPVKIIGGHTGVTTGYDGATHQALEDIALMRTLPNMTVIAPADYEESKKVALAALDVKGPVYVRLTRPATPVFTTENSPFTAGKANTLWENKDPKVAIIAAGPLVHEALKAAKTLSKSKIGSLVVNCHTIKPLDTQAIIRAAKTAECVVTVEDHQINGGLGSAIAEVLGQNFPVPIEMVGVNDQFGESGEPQELLKKFHLTASDIISAAKRAIRRKTVS